VLIFVLILVVDGQHAYTSKFLIASISDPS